MSDLHQLEVRPEKMRKTNPLVAVVVVNWNRAQDTLSCLRSLYACRYDALVVLVVDNHSTDDSVSAIARDFPQARVLINQRNLGYAGGCNLGLRWAAAERADYVLLLNNDAVVDAEAIGRMVSAAEVEGAAMVGPKIYYSRLPMVIWSAGGYVDWRKGHCFNRGNQQVDVGQYQQSEVVEWVNGCALLVRTDVVREIGLLDTGYFMYYEEVDWCMRASRAGHKVLYVPEAVVLHEVGASSSREDEKRRWYRASRLRFLRKHARRRDYLRLLAEQHVDRWLQ